MIKIIVTAVALTFLAFGSLIAEATSNVQKLRFCYEDQELFPHYLKNDANVPQHRPGAAIEIMQALDEKLSGTVVEFSRAPWKRCLNELKLGKVDALIGRYTPERAEFGMFPRGVNGAVDTAKALSVTSSCFIHDVSLPLKWDGVKLDVALPQALIAPMGYSVVKDLKSLGFDVYEASNVKLAHKLLFKGKFKVSLSDCHLTTMPSFIVENRTPVTREYGYLIFSKKFYWNSTDKAEFIWRTLQNLDKEGIYKKYR